MNNEHILWVQQSTKEDTLLYHNGKLVPHDSKDFGRLYSMLCNTESMKQIKNGSKCKIYVCNNGKLKDYILKGHYENTDECGRRVPFMAYISQVQNLIEAKVVLINVSKSHNFDVVDSDIDIQEVIEKKKILLILFLIAVLFGIISYTVLYDRNNENQSCSPKETKDLIDK